MPRYVNEQLKEHLDATLIVDPNGAERPLRANNFQIVKFNIKILKKQNPI